MGKHVHYMTDKDYVARTAVCVIDGPVRLRKRGNAWQCDVAYRETNGHIARDRQGVPIQVKGLVCAVCGFVALTTSQMDLDHIDGDRSNHALENLQTLCPPCHRLKSYEPELFEEFVASLQA